MALIKTFSQAEGPSNVSNISNVVADAAPGVTDDSTKGYRTGLTLWTDTTGEDVYMCMSDAEGAAAWTQLNP